MSFWRFFQRARWDEERARELEAHLAIETDDNIARGMTPDRARAAAHRKLGNATSIREAIYDMNSMSVIETIRLDVRDALRQLRRRPLVTSLAIVLLAIGIAASTAAFSITYGVLLRPLPYPDADRLVAVWQVFRGQRTQVSFPNAADIRDSGAFERTAILVNGRATLSAGTEVDRVNFVQGESSLLPLLGARPLLGRLLQADDAGRPFAILSHRIWQSAFSGDPNIVGKTFLLSGTSHTIVGVAAPGLQFELPVDDDAVAGGFTIQDVDLWMPLDPRAAMAQRREVFTYEVIAMLKSGESIDRAQRALDATAANLERVYPDTNANRTFAAVPLDRHIVARRSPAVRLGFAGALLVLAAAFTNLCSLFLGDLPARRRDFALREALGASRGRLIRQVVVESLLLSCAGGALGFWLARLGVGNLKAAAGLPRLDAIRFDLPVAAAAVGFALVTGVVSRLIPLIRLRPANEGLRASTSVYALAAPRARGVLVAAQFALAVVLTTTAVLLGLSLQQVVALDPGFASSQVLSMRVSAYSTRYPTRAAVARFFDEALTRVAGVAAVEGVAASSALPLTASNTGTSVVAEGRPIPVAERPSAGWQTVTPGYFAALHIPIVAGRDFARADLDRTTHQTIISRALARRMFGDANPIGRRLTFGPDEAVPDWHEVVGVVGDVRHGSLVDADALRAYDLSGQHWSRTMYVVVRTPRDPHAIVPDVRAAVRAMDPEAPVFEVQSLDDVVDGAVSPRRLATFVAVGIASVSLTLAGIGLYGLLASAVAARTRELGIRRALGSPTRAILQLIVGQAAWLALTGAVAGAAVSLAASRWIEAQLFGVHAGDPRALVAIVCVLAGIAIAAAYVPARRAGRVDPAIALREE